MSELFDALKRRSQPAGDSPTPGVNRTRQLEHHLDVDDRRDRHVLEPAVDDQNSSRLHQQSLRHGGLLKMGQIVYSVPYSHWYRVQLEDGGGDLPCCQLTETAPQPLSVKNASPLPPHAPVLVWKPEGSLFGYIVGVLPDIVADGGLVFPTSISQGSNSGFKRESYYADLLRLVNAGIQDYSNSRPLDATALGEWGRFNDLGAGFFLDPFMAFLRIDETCGVWGFYMDRLLRVAGHNLDLRTAGSERRARDDEGEFQDYFGQSVYPWEALGAFAQGVPVHTENSDVDVQYNKPLGKFEPANDDQQPFHRSQVYGGYLGQWSLRQVVLPPDKLSQGQSLLRYSGTDPAIGVFREHVGFNGACVIESAHSLHLLKRTIIPVPKRLKEPEDGTGDTAADYAASGELGSGPKHKISNPEPPDGAKLPGALTAAALLDIHAHACNWQALHPFAYHKKDFDLPEEDTVYPLTAQDSGLTFGDLLSGQWLSQPAPLNLYVDHRYGKQKYFQATAGLSLLPDGNLVLRGGRGCALMFVDGVVRLIAPGDVALEAGRDNIQISGYDSIIKAHNSIDVRIAD